jgi:hypothetical protein
MEESKSKAHRSALQSVIINHVRAYEAGDLEDLIDRLYLGFLSSDFNLVAADRTAHYERIMHLKAFLREVQAHALVELPETANTVGMG